MSSDNTPEELLAALVEKRVYVAGNFTLLQGDQIANHLRWIGSRVDTHLSRKTEVLAHGTNAEAAIEQARSLGVRTLMGEQALLAALRAGGAVQAEPAAPRKQMMNPDPDAIVKASEAIRAAQIDRYGLTIAQLLRCWCRVFAMRPDVHVLHATDRSASSAALAELALRLPAHALAFAAELRSLHFCWVFADRRGSVGRDNLGYEGGRINVSDFEELRWYAEHDGFDASFDVLQPEGSTVLRHQADELPADATPFFINPGSEARDFGSLAGYLTWGAQCAFVWYWQKRGYEESEAFLARLAAASLPPTTPADEVVAGLCARGLDPAEAQAVQRWLGADAVLLLPA
ncbi:hypothetical protein ACNOYE_38765 [Nannocystaceae bacterium ST9]